MVFPSAYLHPSASTHPLTIPAGVVLLTLVRDRPSLRLHIEAETPSGRRYRWGQDEPDPRNVFSGLRHSSTMPGGYESMDCVLPREPGHDYPDLDRLTTLRVLGPGGEIAGEYRLERAPRASGDRMAISPSAVGWQAHLEDDQFASEIYVDRDLNSWQPTSRSWRTEFVDSGLTVFDHSIHPDASSGIPALACNFSTEWPLAAVAFATYDSRREDGIAAIYYDMVAGGGIRDGLTDANWVVNLFASDTDTGTPGTVFMGSNLGVTSQAGYFSPTAALRFMSVRHVYTTNNTVANTREFYWRKLAVYGNHGLTRRGTDPGGFYASDIVAHAVGKWCPLLTFDKGTDGSVRPSSFVIPHLAFHEYTTAGEMVRQATRFGLQDWAVWADKKFHWHERGAFGKRWRTRVGPAQLEETGPQVDRLWNAVVVSYRDVDGSTKTVGPSGSGADTESDVLLDSDPENPANQLGIKRRTKLQMGTSTAAGAVEVGRRFLEQTKLLDSSGRARIVGHIEDDRGILHPYWKVRAGDEIAFVDSNSTSYRRIVKVDHDYGSRSCTVDLDAPPDAMDALLARLDVVLVPLGA